MNVVIFGGSSHSTPALFDYLSHLKQRPSIRITLVGRSLNRLQAVRRAGLILLAGGHAEIRIAQSHSAVDEALGCADVVIVQVRVGGYAGRSFDETFPIKYGICGDEALGPGGLSAAWRAWPVIGEMIKRIDTAAPQALVLILSSPVGLLVRTATRICSRITPLGICELPWTTIDHVCQIAAVRSVDADFDYVGINHVGWIYRLTSGPRDLINEYACIREEAHDFPSADLIRRHAAIPTKYLRLHCHPNEVLNEQRANRTSRGDILRELSEETFPIYEKGTVGQIRNILRKRATLWYSDAIGPLLAAYMGFAVLQNFFLSRPNKGADPNFEYDDVLEVPHVYANGNLVQRVRESNPSTEITGMLKRFLRCETLASDAILFRDRRKLEEALAIHPWVKDQRTVSPMAASIEKFYGDGV